MTKKKTRFRFRPIDFFVVFICLSVFAGSIFLFWKDINKTTTRTDKNSIATISYKYKIAQRKFEDRVVWERIQQDSSLYNLDTIRTADLAEAYITFKDGTVINLYENTMIKISYTEEKGVALNVNGGNIIVDSTKSEGTVSLQLDNGTKVNLEAGSRLEANVLGDGEEGAFILQSGSGSIVSQSSASDGNDSTQSVMALTTGESATVNKDGNIHRDSITVTSVGKDLKVLSFEEDKTVPVHLEWNTSEELADEPVIIQTSRTKDFSVIENTYTETGSSSIDVQAEEGTLYWRVFAKNAENEPVEGKVKVVGVDEVTPASPALSSVYSYRKEPPAIQFGWNGNDYADHYKIEVSTSPDFSGDNVVIDQDVSTQRVSFSELEEGNYYWRVTPYYSVNKIGYAEPTETLSFTVLKKEEAEPPKLSFPLDNAKIVHASENFAANFSWKSEVEDANYQIQIATDENFENLVYSTETNSKRYKGEFDTSALEDGNYFWKVVRSPTDDSDYSESEVRKFTIAKYVPALNRLIFPPDNYAVEEARLSNTGFKWKLADEYKNQNVETVLQISPSADFSSEVTEIETSGITEARNLNLKAGNYFWRVGVLDSVKNEFVYTEERVITVQKELETPVITYPLENQILITDTTAVVNLKWQEVDGADYYKVNILSSDGNLIKEYNEVYKNIQKISLTPDTAGVNEYKVSVQAFALGSENSGARSGKNSTVNFGIRRAGKIRLNVPAENMKIDGLWAIRNPVVFTWQNGTDIPATSEFVLRKVQSDGSVRIVQTLNNSGKSISLERLTEGTYQWTVKASTADGISLSDDKYRSFTVSSIPLLEKADLVSPANNLEMNAAYLRKNRNINFSWKAVPGATDYNFVLYHREFDGSLRRVTGGSTGSNTNYKIKDLSILDIGEFEWQVIAYSYASDGYEEQHSNVAVGHFTINIKRPGRVKAKDPGRLYGE